VISPAPTRLLEDRVAFYHAALFSPVISTWCDAIDAGHFTTWTDLTSAQVRKHFPGSVPMHLGHMDQTGANIQSTKQPSHPSIKPHDDSSPTPISSRTHEVFVAIQAATGKVDQTGRFTTTSTSGNSYLVIIYDYDSNFIHVEPLKSRSGPYILAAYQAAHTLFTSRGFQPRLQRLDNEASNALLQFMATNSIDIQLSPPHIH
jgi:hypothetical protein